jgi:hypothetical protein
MIIPFFLLATLCAISSTQANETKLDDKLLYGKIPPFSTTYIKKIDYKRRRILKDDYEALQRNSLTCIKLRKQTIATAYELASIFHGSPDSDKTIIHNPLYRTLLELQAICEKTYIPGSYNDLSVPDQNLLYHIQWVRKLTPQEALIKLELYDNTTLRLRGTLATYILEHLENNLRTQPPYIPQQLVFIPIPMRNLVDISSAQQNT